MSTPIEPQNDIHLENFGKYCKLFYQRSLSIHDSETTSDEDQAELQASKVVLDALEHHLINVHEDAITSEYQSFLGSSEAKKNSNHLMSCGLLASNVDTSIQPKEVITATPSLTNEALAKYTNIRDQERRNAHQFQMNKRRLYLDQLIKRKIPQPVSASTNHYDKTMGDHLVNSQAFLKHVRSGIALFTRNYKKHIGAHSFFAGVKTMIEKQLEEDKRGTCILWTLNGSTLSEVNFSSSDPSQKHNGEVYMDDAIGLLSSFMLYYPNEDLAEKASSQEHESMYSFFIHGSISNSFLRYILSDLPSSRDLHAKATGTFHCKDTSIGKRDNADGANDEYLGIIPWTQGLRCDIL